MDVMVWVVVARHAGLVEHIEVKATMEEAQAQVATWTAGMEGEDDPDIGGEVYWDPQGGDWYFDVYPCEVRGVRGQE